MQVQQPSSRSENAVPSPFSLWAALGLVSPRTDVRDSLVSIENELFKKKESSIALEEPVTIDLLSKDFPKVRFQL